MRHQAGRTRRLVGAGLVAALVGCSAPVDTPSTGPRPSPSWTESPAPTPSPGPSLPRPGFPEGARPDYQLGGAYPPPAGIGIVVRDRTARPADGIYSVCYVNAFQTQPGEDDTWTGAAASLLLSDGSGPVIDEEWDEVLLDTSTPERREAIAGLVGGWIDGCAGAGFAAVEFDNLDSYLRSDGLLTADDNLALADLLVRRAHAAGLAAGQKNAADLVDRARAIGFDFAVTEECQHYDECDTYLDAYGAAVIEVEYADQPEANLTRACAARGHLASVVRRDRDLVTPQDPGYLAQWCA